MDLVRQSETRALADRAILTELRAIEESRSKTLSDELRARFALAPYWPLELAGLGLDISGDPRKRLEPAVRQHVLESRAGVFPWSQPVFWMPPSERESALARLSRGARPGFLQKELSHSGLKLLSNLDGALKERLRTDLLLWRWATLAAAAEQAEQFDLALAREIDAALRASAAAGHLASPEALRWIEVAEPIADALHGGYEIAVATARRRVELFDRQGHDRRKLENYFVRKELDQTTKSLLDDKEHWAVHFKGAGGTGKTMLLRHISIHLASDLNIAVSRIDFDYLNPDYPERKPGLMLKALAEEFRLQASTDAARAFSQFDDACNSMHRLVEGTFRQGQAARMDPRDALFHDVLKLFAEGMSRMVGGRRPVIMLDTCEELAKIQGDGKVPRNVADTFLILETLHELLPDVRVIFSGRRELPQKTYLQVCGVLGFNESDANEFLARYRLAEGGSVQVELVPEIMRLSLASKPPEARYNPYDLDTYAAWVSADASLSAERLSLAGPHLYVKERIIDRLDPVVRRILPSLAILERFDGELIQAIIGPGESTTNYIGEVLSQEWVQSDIAGTLETWRIDTLLRERLLRYYQDQSRSAFASARQGLSDLLPGFIRERPFSKLTPQLFSACLDVLMDRPTAASRWWDEIETRIASEAQWEWASELMKFLRPSSEAIGKSREPLKAALLATHSAVALHTSGESNLSIWEAVLESAKLHPAPDLQHRLEFRARLALGREVQSAFPETPSLQDLASVIAAVEFTLEKEVLDPEKAARCRMLLSFVAHSTQAAELLAFGGLLQGRLAAAAGNSEESRSCFDEALRRSAIAEIDGRQMWLDWIRPANLNHRILLEFARTHPEHFARVIVERKGELPTPPLRNLDSDRLAAEWIRFNDSVQSFSESPLQNAFRSLYSSSLELIGTRPTCGAHRAVSPCFLVLLDVCSASGEVDWAYQELTRLSKSTLDQAADISFGIDLQIARLVHRMRLTSEGVAIPQRLLSSQDEPTTFAVAAPTAFSVPLNLLSGYDLQRVQGWLSGRSKPTSQLEMTEIAFLRRDSETPSKAREALVSAQARADRFGCLRARILLALWYARTGDRDKAREEALKAQGDYSSLAGRSATLPSWQALQNALDQDSVITLLDTMGPKPSLWRPWIVRLLACLSERPEQQIRPWLLNEATVFGGSNLVFPPELDFLVSSGSESVAASPKAEESPASSAVPNTTNLAGWGTAVAALFGVGLAFGSLWASYRFLFLPLLRWLHLSSGTKWDIGTYFALLASLSQLPRLVKFLANLYVGSVRMEVDVVYPTPPADLNRPLASPGLVRCKLFCLGLPLGSQRTTELNTSTAEAYSSLRRELSLRRPLTTWLWRTVSWFLPDAALETVVFVDDSSAAAPWEAVLGEDAESSFATSSVFLRRATRVRTVGTQPPWRAPVGVVTTDPLAIHRTREDWGTNFQAYLASDSENYRILDLNAGVLHFAGSPVDSSSGLVMRAGGYGKEDVGSYTSLTRAGDLLSRYPGVRLCILQCPPSEGLKRLSSDRRLMAVFKRFAAQVFASGVPMVVVVPVLPAHMADDLIDRFYKVLAATPRNAVPVVERLILAFRRDLLRGENDSDDVREVSADLCLYSRRRVDFRVDPPASPEPSSGGSSGRSSGRRSRRDREYEPRASAAA
jgi:hypothetical protein